jgi:hypothetical protein
VAISFLYESKLAAEVRGVILDRPRGGPGRDRRPRRPRPHPPLLGLPVPAPLTATAKAVAGVRYALDWRRLDYHRIAPVAG